MACVLTFLMLSRLNASTPVFSHLRLSDLVDHPSQHPSSVLLGLPPSRDTIFGKHRPQMEDLHHDAKEAASVLKFHKLPNLCSSQREKAHFEFHDPRSRLVRASLPGCYASCPVGR